MLIYFIGFKICLVYNNMSKGKFYFIVFLLSLLLSSCSNTDLYTNRFVRHTHKKTSFFQYLLIVKVIFNINNFSSSSDSKKADKRRHPTSPFWFLESLIGFTGAILNCSVLYIFHIERQNLISAVNVMTRQGIFRFSHFTVTFFSLHTFFRLLYCFATFWRNLVMFLGPEFIISSYGRELAKSKSLKITLTFL